MLFCIQVVQINDNESDRREKKINILMQTSQKKCELAMKAKNLNS